jgi:hypothetical protein
VALLQADGNPAEAGTGISTGALPAPGGEEYQMSRAAVADPSEGRRKMMRALGYVTAVTLAVAGIVLGVMAVKALPETQRYLAMRKI